jgi:hypothetical protein
MGPRGIGVVLIARTSAGTTKRSCTKPAQGECRPDGRW